MIERQKDPVKEERKIERMKLTAIENKGQSQIWEAKEEKKERLVARPERKRQELREKWTECLSHNNIAIWHQYQEWGRTLY